MKNLDRKIIEEINNQGWQSVDGRDSVAMVIGGRIDTKRMINDLEVNENYADLETYIRNKKQIKLPRSEMFGKIAEWADRNVGVYWRCNNHEDIYFVDTNKDLAHVKIVPQKIDSFKECVLENASIISAVAYRDIDGTKVNSNLMNKLTKKELYGLGFSEKKRIGMPLDKIYSAINMYQQGISSRNEKARRA